MGGANKLIGTLTGGLLGQPDIKTPKAPKPPKTDNLDPNTGAALAAARRRRAAVAGAQGRKAFRIDLGTVNPSDQQTRSGITIS